MVENFEFGQKDLDLKNYTEIHKYFSQFFISASEEQFDKAKTVLEALLRKYPETNLAHFFLGAISNKLNDTDGAIKHYSRYLELVDSDINNTDMQNQLEYESSMAHYNLGNAYFRQNNLEKAAYHWNKALEINPYMPKVLNNLAWLKTDIKNKSFYSPQEALVLAQRACDLTDNNDPGILDTLSLAYFSCGKTAEAIEISQKALELAVLKGDKNLAAEIRGNLEIYQGRKP